MQEILALYLSNRAVLDLAQRQSFAFTVLSLAYCDQAAVQAVGYPQGAGSSGGGNCYTGMTGPDVCYGGTCETMGDTNIFYPDE